eukprot:m.2601 g.2601  ORF g.2601 m.2601 type:complete len:57 (+) comp2976_c0_seq1:113-283(+)
MLQLFLEILREDPFSTMPSVNIVALLRKRHRYQCFIASFSAVPEKFESSIYARQSI